MTARRKPEERKTSRPALWTQIPKVPTSVVPKEKPHSLPTVYYRAWSFYRWLGPWQETLRLAQNDAVRAGEASWDDMEKHLYTSVGCEIMTMRGPVIGR